LPFMVKKNCEPGLAGKIKELVKEGRLPEVADMYDHTDKRGMRFVIELKRDAIPKVVLNKLDKHTPMQTTFGVNMVALVDGVPRTLNLREAIKYYVEHQCEVIVRRTKHELSEKEARAHMLEGLLTALEHLGDERRTEISHSEDEIDIEDLIADQQMVITITQSGYIKSLPLATYRQQQRGGRGVTGMDMKDGDFIEHLFVTSSHDYLLFF